MGNGIIASHRGSIDQLIVARCLSHEEILANGNVVAVFGAAGGTIAANQWRTPAAWLAEVENGLVKKWRVYADNKPVYDILAKCQKQA